MAPKGLWNVAPQKKRMLEEREERCLKRRKIFNHIIQGHARREFSLPLAEGWHRRQSRTMEYVNEGTKEEESKSGKGEFGWEEEDNLQ